MILLVTASAWRAPGSFLAQSPCKQSPHKRSPRKRAALAVAVLSLVTGFGLAGAPAIAAAAVPSNDHVVLVAPDCVGEKPGMCPD